jgi:hypothetical protein
VTANHGGKLFGDVAPVLTYTASGFKFIDTAATILIGSLVRAPGETVADGPYAITQGSLALNTSNYVLAQFTPSLFTIYPTVVIPSLVFEPAQTQVAEVAAFQTGNMQFNAFCVALPEHYYNPTNGYQCVQPGIADMGKEIVKVIDGGIRLPKEQLGRKE